MENQMSNVKHSDEIDMERQQLELIVNELIAVLALPDGPEPPLALNAARAEAVLEFTQYQKSLFSVGGRVIDPERLAEWWLFSRGWLTQEPNE